MNRFDPAALRPPPSGSIKSRFMPKEDYRRHISPTPHKPGPIRDGRSDRGVLAWSERHAKPHTGAEKRK
jgi:hypothetical protein